MRRARVITAVCTLWLGTAGAIGYLGAVAIDAHGSFVFVLFALSVGLFGAVAHTVLATWAVCARLPASPRALAAAALASSPMVILAAWGVLYKPLYTFGAAAAFAGPFVAGALAVGFVVEYVIRQWFLAAADGHAT